MARDDETLTFRATRGTARAVARALDVAAPKGTKLERCHYDTFDGRLAAAGLRLVVARVSGGGATATLSRLSDNLEHWSMRADDGIPSLATEMPPGPWARTLAPVVGIRALVALESEQVTTTTLAVRDREGKVVVSVDIDARSPASRVRVIPRRGYEREAARVARVIGTIVGVTPDMHAAAAQPEIANPQRGTRADDAVRALLQTQIEVMRHNEPWIAAAPDTEFLHDWRVALRRARSVLKHADDVVAHRILERWRPALRDLQQRTNQLRDLDVLALEMPELRRLVPGSYASDLDPLGELVCLRRDQERAVVAAGLASAPHRRLVAGLSRTLDGRLADRAARDASRMVEDVAAERIARAHRRLLRGGRAVEPASPAEAVHEVRIRAKELRYLLELYGSLFDDDQSATLVRALKRLQDNLGEFQDCEVHAIELEQMAADLQRDGSPARTLMAIGLLTDAFVRRQQRARDEFAERFGRFERDGGKAAVQKLLAT